MIKKRKGKRRVKAPLFPSKDKMVHSPIMAKTANHAGSAHPGHMV